MLKVVCKAFLEGPILLAASSFTATGWQESFYPKGMCPSLLFARDATILIPFGENTAGQTPVVFKAYFDESWDAYQKTILLFGGMIGRYEEWAKIEWPWKQLLEKYEIEYYRATEAEHARGQFKKHHSVPFRTL